MSPVPHFNLGQSAKSVGFPVEMTMNSLNKALENDGSEGIDHSHIPLNVFRGNTSFPLNLLASTLESLPIPYYVNLDIEYQLSYL